MEERRKANAGIYKELKDIKTLLMGNGKVGIAEMARRAFEYFQAHSKSKNSFIDWAFRAVILLFLIGIFAKLGWK